MIKPEELRRNNLLMQGADIVTVRGLPADEFIQYSIESRDNDIIYGEPSDEFEPIELTEEWLNKVGFEKDDVDFYTLMLIDKPSAKISINLDWQITEVCQAGYGFSVQCICVHQLQNLFYCLCGKEL